MQMLAETLSILWTNRIGFAAGLWVTLKLVGCIWSVGLVAGIFLGTLGEKLPRSFGLLLQLFSAFFAAIPAIVLLFWAYFPLQMLLGVDIDPFWTAAGTLSLLNTVSAAEIIRREIMVRGSFSYNRENFFEALRRLQNEEVHLDPWITEAPLEDGGKWFDRLIDAPGNVAKVLLVP